jgi:hypothetical protein
MSTALKENKGCSVTGHSHRHVYDSTSEYAHASEARPLTCKLSTAILTFVEGLLMDDNYLYTESFRDIENSYSSKRIKP